MARYDRLAALPAPPRHEALPGWSVLRDLEERERDAALARRVRLRFLALRPVHRLLARGLQGVSTTSYEQQVDSIREELGLLSARDPERRQLARFLRRIRRRTPLALVLSTLDMGRVIEEQGHGHAAEEYYRTALELAVTHGQAAEEVAALRLLGGVCRMAGRGDHAEAYYHRAAERALELPARRAWARALDGVCTVQTERQQLTAARRTAAVIAARAEEWADADVSAIAARAHARLALAEGDAGAALSHGWAALRALEGGDEAHEALDLIARACLGLGLHEPAERCFHTVLEHATAPLLRDRARAGYALAAAEAGDADAFHQRRRHLLEATDSWGRPPGLRAAVHLDLARGCARAGEVDAALDHLRKALDTPEPAAPATVARARELRAALETGDADGRPATARPRGDTDVLRIAAALSAYLDAEAPA